jgi:hypothetical protein
VQASQFVSVADCYFNDLSGGFLKLGSVVDDSGASSPNPADWDSYASVFNNVASNMALEYKGAAGLFGGCVW